MTTQSAINQSIGTSTNIGNSKFSINPLTLAAGTTAFVVNMKVTNGTGLPGRNQVVRVWYTTTMRTVTAANAPKHLGPTARFVEAVIADENEGVVIKDSSLEPVTGSLFHCWVDVPTLPTAATLLVDLVEI